MVEDEGQDHLAGYVEVTLEQLAVAHLRDAAAQLVDVDEAPIRLFLAARSVHLALVSALTSAVAGSSSTGAYPLKEQRKWIEYFERSRTDDVEAPQGDRVMSFKDLLAQATGAPVGWFTSPLSLSEEEKGQIERLTALRDWTEHPRPRLHYIDPLWIIPALTAGLKLANECLMTVSHRLDEVEVLAARQAVEQVRSRARAIETEKSRAPEV